MPPEADPEGKSTMKEIQTLPGVKREKTGRGSARAARRDEMIPSIIYGGDGVPQTINVFRKDVVRVIERGNFLSNLINLDIEGVVERVFPKDAQMHPLNDYWPIHIDFLRMPLGARTIINVPVEFINQDICVGIKAGGTMNVVRYEIEFSVDVDNIPRSIIVDMQNVKIGNSVHISAVPLPESVKPVITRDFTIATVVAPSGGVTEQAEEGSEDQSA